MTPPAQTNLQLYRQLCAGGAADQDLAAVRRAYETAASLFAGLYRASGKPFLTHLVGTASVVAQERVALPLVLAAMLHAAYVQGRFGDGPPGRTQRRAKRLAHSIGTEAERLVTRYATFPWHTRNFRAEADLLASLDPLDRDALTLRLANEVEEMVDFGLLYHGDAEQRRAEALEALPVWVCWAKELSLPRVAEALEEAAAELSRFRAPESLRTDRTRSYIPGNFCPPTLASRARRAAGRVRTVLRRLAPRRVFG